MVHVLIVNVVVALFIIPPGAAAFQALLRIRSPSSSSGTTDVVCTSLLLNTARRRQCAAHHKHHNIASTSKLNMMVRNIDLPEALVFYGVESIMEPNQDESDGLAYDVIRPGISRLLNECREVGTAALFLCEEADLEDSLRMAFQRGYGLWASENGGEPLEEFIQRGQGDPILHFRCLSSEFVPTSPPEEADPVDIDEYDDESLEFYNLQVNSRSPSPAFLLDSLGSIGKIDPRAFGGSSGFGRGQWVEPRRRPLPARSVVFIAGDNVSTSSNSGFPKVKDRCDAARAAGCRVIYLENLDDTTQHLIEDDSLAISLCDAIIDSFGNDNPRDIQPITLDAVSTPGDYWLNPPNPRDDKGNAVLVDELVEWFRSERESNTVEDTSCVAEEVNQEMSEDEMAIILADMDGL